MESSVMGHPRVQKFSASLAPDFCVVSARCRGDEVLVKIKLSGDQKAGSASVLIGKLSRLGPASPRLRKWLWDFFFLNDRCAGDGASADPADWWKTDSDMGDRDAADWWKR
jgi:hypothetical protein